MSQSYFSQIAESWDGLRAAMFSDEVRAIAIERAGLPSEGIAVDLGSGTGFLSLGLASRTATVHTVDSSPEMQAIARKNLAEFSNIQYHLTSGPLIPLPEASVDAVLANMYLHHIPEPALALAEIARVLRPGGRVVITDLDEHPYTWLRDEQEDIWLGFQREQVRAWMEAAELVNVLIEDTRESCSTKSLTQPEQASVSIFVAAATKPDKNMSQQVQRRYREIATAAAGCGCGGKTAPAPPASETSILLEVIQPTISSCCTPAEAGQSEAALFLGCGNPLALASLQPGETVLDIGSGAGADLFPAARKVGPHGKAIGVDLLEEMLEQARKTAQQNGITNVKFRQGDAGHLPVEDASVDVVMSNCVINLVQDKGSAFREAYRALRSGGRLSISDVVTDRPFSASLRNDPDAWSACISGALPEREYLALIAQAGFTEISAARSQSWTAEDGTQVYSLSIRARKP